MSASGLLPTIGPEVPVTSPLLPVYPTITEVVLKSTGYGVSGNAVATTTGSAQLLAEIPVSALGIDLLTSAKALLVLETSQDNSGISGGIGCAFSVGPTDLSNATSTSRDYGSLLYPIQFTTSTSLVLDREVDYPAGTSNISIWIIANHDTMSYPLSTSNALSYSYSLVSLA